MINEISAIQKRQILCLSQKMQSNSIASCPLMDKIYEIACCIFYSISDQRVEKCLERQLYPYHPRQI